MKNRLNKIFKILYKNKEIEVIIKKNKLSKNYKLTFDKKKLSGLVSIPRHVSFSNGFTFAQENSNWLIEQHNEMMPLIILKNGAFLYFEGKKRELVFLNDKRSNIELSEKTITITNNHIYPIFQWAKLFRNTLKSFSTHNNNIWFIYVIRIFFIKTINSYFFK